MNHPTNRTNIFINDVTLRDGEQAPGNTMSAHDKMIIAVQLGRLGVNGMEAGFPAASDGDFQSVHSIAETIGQQYIPSTNTHPRISGLARLCEGDIKAVLSAVKPAPHRGVHTFIATSKEHLSKFVGPIRQAGGNPDSMKDFISKVVIPGIESNFDIIRTSDPSAKIQFSLEDWTRTNDAVSDDVILAAVYNGANIINLPDTVGVGIPRIIYKRVFEVRKLLDNAGFHDVIISWHGHNDTGQGIACAIEALYAGARQFEPTILGIGERTGNYSFEGFLAAMDAHHAMHESIVYEPINDTLVRAEVMKTALLVAHTIGIEIPREHPIVGGNAFAEESGIHVDGIAKGGTSAYHALNAEKYGTKRKVTIGKHAGWANMVDFCTRRCLPFQDKDRSTFMRHLKAAAEDRRKGLSDDEVMDKVYHPTIKELTGVATIHRIREIENREGILRQVEITMNLKDNRTEKIIGTASNMFEGVIDAAINALRQFMPTLDVADYSNKMPPMEHGSASASIGTVILRNGNGTEATGRCTACDVDAANLGAIANAFDALRAQEKYARMIAEADVSSAL